MYRIAFDHFSGLRILFSALQLGKLSLSKSLYDVKCMKWVRFIYGEVRTKNCNLLQIKNGFLNETILDILLIELLNRILA